MEFNKDNLEIHRYTYAAKRKCFTHLGIYLSQSICLIRIKYNTALCMIRIKTAYIYFAFGLIFAEGKLYGFGKPNISTTL